MTHFGYRELTQIKQDLEKLPEHKLAEVRDFIQRLLPTQPPAHRARSLRGVWKGLGWANMDVEKEVKTLRSDVSDAVLKKLS